MKFIVLTPREGHSQNAVIHDTQGINVTWNKENNRFIINLLINNADSVWSEMS